MYNTGKQVSIKMVLEKVYRDYGFNTDIAWADVIEWTAEAINLLGVAPSYTDKVSKKLELVNGRVELPCDIMYIKMVRDFDTGEPLIRSFDQFHLSNYFRCSDEQVATEEDYCEVVNTYTVNQNFLFTSYDEGNIEISYKAMPTDDDGLPTVPDNEKYIRYVKDYIAEKLAFKLFMQDKLAQHKLDRIEQKSCWSAGAAKNAMVIPDMDQMESWKNAWLRLIPNVNHHSASFKYLSQPSQQKNHNSY
jgi:hypothetical protein